MVQFADVLTQVGADVEETAERRGVRVNTAGWDSWLDQDSQPKPPTPSAFYLNADDLVDDAEDEAPIAPAARPLREEILRSAYTGPDLGAPCAASRPALDLSAELAPARLIMMSEADLHALRRRLARRVHPDLPTADQPDAEAMVRVNVAIDAALRDRRLRLARR